MSIPFAEALYEWHEKVDRELPWKATRDPYPIWVSEVILQQTRVAQGLPYYHRFIKTFPTIRDLATADEDSLMAVWKGLGYYSRARNMHAAARRIVEDHGGRFPDNYDELLALPGVGPYTAAAIASFAYGMPYPVIDGNVKRVMSRFDGMDEPIDTSAGEKRLKAALSKVFDAEAPDLFNQAIMDLGALVCTPANPACTRCPLQNGCSAFLEDLTRELPVKIKQVKRGVRNFHYFVVTDGRKVVLSKRTGRDIWRGLYQPLLLESEKAIPISERKQAELLGEWLGVADLSKPLEVVTGKQLLSHQEIHAIFYLYHVEELPVPSNIGWILADLENLSNFAVPRVVDWYLTDFSIPLKSKR